MFITDSRYLDAVEREQLNRDAAFVLDTQILAGFKVRQMNLWHYTILRVDQNPLLYGERPTLPELAQFIWAISVDYKPSASAQTRWFKNSCSHLMEPRKPLIHTRRAMRRYWRRFELAMSTREQTLVACENYIRDTMMDRPKSGSKRSKTFYSDAAFWCGLMGRNYKYSKNETMLTPLRQLFQFLNEIKEHHHGPAAVFNPSDDVLAQWQMEQVALRKN